MARDTIHFLTLTMVLLAAFPLIPQVGAENIVENFTVIKDQLLIHLVWDEHPDAAEDTYYQIVRNDSQEDFLIQYFDFSTPLANVTDTEYIDEDVHIGYAYIYGLRLVNSAGSPITDIEKTWATVKIYNEAPLPPINIVVSLNYFDESHLEWEEGSSDTAWVRIFRREEGEQYNLSDYEKIFLYTTEFTDGDLERNKTYFYRMLAEDGFNSVEGTKISVLSEEVSIYVPPVSSYATEVGLDGSGILDGELAITWEHSHTPNVWYYNIYVETEPIVTTEGLEPLDTYLEWLEEEYILTQDNFPLVWGEEYYVAVTAVNWTLGENEPTEDSTAGPVIYELAFPVEANYFDENNGSLQVQWVSNTVSNFSHYEVFISNNTEITPVNAIAIVENQTLNFIDLTRADFPFENESEYYVGVAAILNNSNHTKVNVADPIIWNPYDPSDDEIPDDDEIPADDEVPDDDDDALPDDDSETPDDDEEITNDDGKIPDDDHLPDSDEESKGDVDFQSGASWAELADQPLSSKFNLQVAISFAVTLILMVALLARRPPSQAGLDERNKYEGYESWGDETWGLDDPYAQTPQFDGAAKLSAWGPDYHQGR